MRAIFALVLLCAAGTFAIPRDNFGTNNIIEGHGYPCQQHYAPTTDGWKLSMQRIPFGLKNATRRGAVLFQHGLTDSSAGVVLNNPQESLAFILADAGYDVWLGNNRGNGISMDNTKYNPSQPQFWDFSFDEMAQYDLPGQIDYILKTTGEKKIFYIGHSEGTIQAFAGFLDPELASKVKIFIALAPVAHVGHVTSPILQAMAKLGTDVIFELLGLHEFYLPSVIHKILPGYCTLFPHMCEFVLDIIAGPFPNVNLTRIPYYLNYEPNPTSVKNMAHWSQGLRQGTFKKFDYGKQGNIDHYGQPDAPVYDLKKWPSSLPVALFCGALDWLADPTDVQILLSELPSVAYTHYEANYGHLDPLLAPNANTHIYPLIIDLLHKYR